MIKIINGIYGYKKNGSVIPKTSKDAPFECDKAEEARLVKLGVAAYVKAEANEGNGLDKEALIARYKELGLGGNPATWKAETIAKKIEEAEAKAKANEGNGEGENEGEGEGNGEGEGPDLGNDDGVVE